MSNLTKTATVAAAVTPAVTATPSANQKSNFKFSGGGTATAAAAAVTAAAAAAAVTKVAKVAEGVNPAAAAAAAAAIPQRGSYHIAKGSNALTNVGVLSLGKAVTLILQLYPLTINPQLTPAQQTQVQQLLLEAAYIMQRANGVPPVKYRIVQL